MMRGLDRAIWKVKFETNFGPGLSACGELPSR